MRVLIIEDESPAYRRLHQMLDKIRPDFEIIEVIDNVKDSIKWLRNHKSPDLIFSDIQLADGISFDIYKAFAPECPIIFTTAYDEYMLQAFKVNGIDYLLKPIQEKELLKGIEKFESLRGSRPDIEGLIKALSEDQKKYRDRFLVKVGSRLLPLAVSEIAYFCHKDGATELHVKNGKMYILDHSLDDLEDQLDPNIFFRLNRKFLSHIESIVQIHQYFKGKLKIELSPEIQDEVTVSREKARSFKNWIDGMS